ncbi:MAG: AIR synthase-related protein, partial [Cyanobacteriota bacterium]|nr:AIR synthase-related protein [Cyanobacteriota bacterium]
VDEDQLIDGRAIQAGHALVGVASSGVHSNGFSLVRRILGARGIEATVPCAALGGATPADALLEPTLLYGGLVRTLIDAGLAPLGMAHITGGGLPENLPRCLPAGLAARVDSGSWERPALFRWLQDQGDIPEADLWHTFNLGVGLVLVVPPEGLVPTLAAVDQAGFQGWPLGEVIAGPRGVIGLPDGS